MPHGVLSLPRSTPRTLNLFRVKLDHHLRTIARTVALSVRWNAIFDQRKHTRLFVNRPNVFPIIKINRYRCVNIFVLWQVSNTHSIEAVVRFPKSTPAAKTKTKANLMATASLAWSRIDVSRTGKIPSIKMLLNRLFWSCAPVVKSKTNYALDPSGLD